MIEDLIKANCIKIGSFKLKNGNISKYYYDMKNLISHPQLLKKIGDELYNMLDDFDIICGIPYGALPIATYISTQYNKPMIYIRDKAKTYGTEKLIEGEYTKKDRCVIIDDVITTGKSLTEEINKLQDKVNIVDVAVVFNRQQNPSDIKFKSLLCKNDVTRYLLNKVSLDKQSNLIFSADISDSVELLNIVDKIGKYIVGCKIHYDILDDSEGNFASNMVKLSIKHNFLIIEDRKFNDISYIVSKQYKKFSNWVDMVTVHSLVPVDVVQNLSGALIVANMSNNTYNFTTDAIEIANKCYHNVVGFITQQRINIEGMVNMTPGISLKKGSINDQNYRGSKNVDTDFIIVGRAIYMGDLDSIEQRVKNLVKSK